MYIQRPLSPNSSVLDQRPTEFKHVVPALTEDVPGFRKQSVHPSRHGHGKKRHYKHGVDTLNETLGLFWNDLIEAADPGFKQHRGNT